MILNARAVLWLGRSFLLVFLVPVMLCARQDDMNVNSRVAAEWFANVKAPSKEFVWFENSAHLPMTEEPGKFLFSLVCYARPIAERAGDVLPVLP